MSYTIIYDKQFIKVKEDLFVPMTLAGANNCTEMSPNGGERRERSWSGWFWSDGILFSEAKMLELNEERRKEVIENNNKRERDSWFEEYTDNRYGYWVGLSIGGADRSHITSFASLQNLIKTGCRKALTVEQLADSGVSVWVSTPWVWDGIEKVHGLKPLGKVAKSGEDLMELYDLVVEYLKGTKLSPTITFSGIHDETPTRLRKKYFPRKAKAKKLVTVPHTFAIEIFKDGERLGRLHRFSRGGSFTYHYSGGGKRYVTEAEAIRRAKIANSKRSNCEFKVEKVEGEREVWMDV